MTADIPDGAAFTITRRGDTELWQIISKGAAFTTVQRELQPGETVYRAVVKLNHIERRDEYILQPGDVECTTRENDIFPGRIVYMNRFKGRAPAWLRAAT